MEQKLKQILKNADAAFNAGEIDKAKELYESALENQPDSAHALFGMGSFALQQKDYQTAQNSLRRAAELEPEAVDITVNYAACLATLGNRIGALTELQRATRYCRDDPYFCSRIADMSLHLGEPAAAITLLSRLQKMLPQDQIILANSQAALGNWRDAVNILKRLHQVVDTDPVVADKLATAAGKLRDYPTSIAAYERYLQLVTPTANDYLRFADLLLIAQNADRCNHALDLAIEMGEDGADVHLLRARTARLNGDIPAVLKSIEQVLERQSNHGQAWSIRAELAEAKQLDEYISELSKELENTLEIAKLNSRHQSLLHFALADMNDRSGDFSGAAKALKYANHIQYTDLVLKNTNYNAELTEQQFDDRIELFGIDVFDQSDASISSGDTQIKPIFVVGMPRSGTTLVERILGENDQVYNAGEQEAMEFVATDYRQKIGGGILPKPGEMKAEQWAALRKTYLEKLPDISKPIFTDKLPHNFRQVGLILKLFPDAKIVQMHRSIQDVCLSIYQHAFSEGHNYANRWQDLIHFYKQSERIMAHWSGMHTPNILDLSYENLVQNPEHYAKQMVEFCGFTWDDSYLDFHKTVNQSFTFSEMQVRKPISTKRVDRWRNYADHIPELADL